MCTLNMKTDTDYSYMSPYAMNGVCVCTCLSVNNVLQ